MMMRPPRCRAGARPPGPGASARNRRRPRSRREGRRRSAAHEQTAWSSRRVSGLVRPQEAKKFHAFAQAALHHVPAPQHLPDDFPDFIGPEIEALVENLHAVEDFL